MSRFEKEVNKVYDILWELYKGKDNKGCDFNTKEEEKLYRILNKIDDELGRG